MNRNQNGKNLVSGDNKKGVMASGKNIVGPHVRQLRIQRGWTHHQLAVELAAHGVFFNEKSLEQIESQDEFVSTVEVAAFATVFQIKVDDLFPPEISLTEISELLHPLPQDDRSASEGSGEDGFGPN